MRQIAGIVFDSLALARDAGEISGVLAVKELPRLSELAAEDGGALTCHLRGGRNEAGKLYLRLVVSGELPVMCQRCLKVLMLPLRVESTLLLVPPGASWPDEELTDDSADAIEALAEQSLASLVEDEVLLAVPLAPRHESCALPGGDGNDAGPESPFAILARIK